MPEGPEIHVAGRLVNRVSDGRIYSGKVLKSAVSTKNPDVPWDEPGYTISATTRGKEIRLILTKSEDDSAKGRKKKQTLPKNGGDKKQVHILFRFGMSGKFVFKPKSEMDKHNHLNFFSRDDDMVLSFNDYRRFGRWEITEEWGNDRGPCIILEYELFRKNVLTNLDAAAFNKPICEAMLNQKFFNGTGNYLRAEILYRLRIPPFSQARSVLEPIGEAEEASVKTEEDLLKLCHLVAMEVLNLNKGRGNMYDPRDDKEGFGEFLNWLQCYNQEGMNNIVDHNGRTVWFTGPAGPLKPKESKSRGKVSRVKNATKEAAVEEPEESTGPKKAKMMKKDEEVEVKKEKLSRNTRANVKSKGGKGKAAKVSVKSNIKTPTTPTPRKTPKQKKEIKDMATQSARPRTRSSARLSEPTSAAVAPAAGTSDGPRVDSPQKKTTKPKAVRGKASKRLTVNDLAKTVDMLRETANENANSMKRLEDGVANVNSTLKDIDRKLDLLLDMVKKDGGGRICNVGANAVNSPPQEHQLHGLSQSVPSSQPTYSQACPLPPPAGLLSQQNSEGEMVMMIAREKLCPSAAQRKHPVYVDEFAMPRPFMYLQREGLYTNEQKLEVRSSMSYLEFMNASLALVVDKAFDPRDADNILAHILDVSTDALDRPWPAVRRWSQHVWDSVAKGRCNWADREYIRDARIRISITGGYFGNGTLGAQGPMCETGGSDHHLHIALCRDFNRPHGCRHAYSHDNGEVKLLHACAHCDAMGRKSKHSFQHCRLRQDRWVTGW